MMASATSAPAPGSGAVPTTLRAMHWRDIPAVAVLERECFPHDAWSEATFWAELAGRPRRDYVVATQEDGTVRGYAGLDLAGDVADVMTVAVDPDHRGHRLGTRLLEHLHATARAAGAKGMMLEVRADNAPARALYDQHGYAVLRTRRGYYRTTDGSPAVDALIMRKELSTDGR